jgi:hypothetical protein
VAFGIALAGIVGGAALGLAGEVRISACRRTVCILVLFIPCFALQGSIEERIPIAAQSLAPLGVAAGGVVSIVVLSKAVNAVRDAGSRAANSIKENSIRIGFVAAVILAAAYVYNS